MNSPILEAKLFFTPQLLNNLIINEWFCSSGPTRCMTKIDPQVWTDLDKNSNKALHRRFELLTSQGFQTGNIEYH